MQHKEHIVQIKNKSIKTSFEPSDVLAKYLGKVIDVTGPVEFFDYTFDGKKGYFVLGPGFNKFDAREPHEILKAILQMRQGMSRPAFYLGPPLFSASGGRVFVEASR